MSLINCRSIDFKKIIRLLLLTFSFSLPLTCIASGQLSFDHDSQLRFKNITMLDGLPDSRVITILRQRHGLMWFGTQAGLVSYDGYEFVNYNQRTRPSIIGNKVNHLFEDLDGNVWVSTTSGISMISASGATKDYAVVNSIESEWANQIFQDTQGRFWSANNDGLAYLNQDGDFELIAFHTQNDRAFVINITEVNGTLFISTTTGLYTKSVHDMSSPLINISQVGMLTSMFNSDDGFIWYGGYYEGLYRLNVETQELKSFEIDGLESTRFSYINVQNNHLYLATFTDGIFHYNIEDGTTQNIRHDRYRSNSLLSNDVFGMLFDPSGILWVTTSRGVSFFSQLKQGSFVAADESIIDNDAKIFQTLPIANNNILLTSETGTAQFNTTTKKLSETDITLPKNIRSYSVSHVPGKGYWFAHDNGISYYELQSKTTTTFGKSDDERFNLPGELFYTVSAIDADEAWVSGHLGAPVFKFSRTKGILKKYLADKVNPYSRLKAFTYASVLHKDVLWLATNIAVVRIDLKTDKIDFLYPTDDNTPAEFTDITVDAQNNIWIASSNFGVMKVIYEASKDEYQLVSAGISKLKNEILITNVLARDGNIWISTQNKIYRYRQYKDSINAFPNLFPDIDIRLVPNSMSIDSETLLIGSNNGLVTIDTKKIRSNRYQPKVILTTIQSGEQNLNHLIGQSDIDFEHGFNNLEFTFASLDYHASNTVNYRYRLKGLDERWRKTTANKASYTNLSWGSYVLQVKGTNSDGHWSDNEIEFKFSIRPAWWFYVIIFLTFSALFFLLLYLYSRQRRYQILQKEARIDYLTGIGNRAEFNQQLERNINKKEPFTLILFDIQNLKQVNDRKGYLVGDKVIQTVVQRLQDWLPSGDFCARIGGDEFAVVSAFDSNRNCVAHYTTDLLAILNSDYDIDNERLHCAFSVGVIGYPDCEVSATQLHKNCDLALFESKQKGVNTITYFDDVLQQQLRIRMSISHYLQQVLEKNELRLVYQPKWDLTNNLVTGAEAMVRWNHPTEGEISPALFIPEAEKNGTILEIGEWVLWTACKQAFQWYQQGVLRGRIAVNVSVMQLQQAQFVDRVLAIINQTGLPHQYLEIEITESIFVEETSLITEVLEKLREAEISIALDDFGSGYSSLGYLTRFPIDTLKIDRSLITDLENSQQQQIVLHNIARLSSDLNLQLVVEGIETHEQLQLLQQYQCQTGQGFLLSKPIPANDFEKLLKQQRH